MPKRKPQTEKTQQQLRQVEENADRWTHDFFGFWMICKEKACRRAQGCVGETRPCFERHWPLVPEKHKQWFRAFIKASQGGTPWQEAARAADAEVKRIAALDAELESQTVMPGLDPGIHEEGHPPIEAPYGLPGHPRV